MRTKLEKLIEKYKVGFSEVFIIMELDQLALKTSDIEDLIRVYEGLEGYRICHYLQVRSKNLEGEYLQV